MIYNFSCNHYVETNDILKLQNGYLNNNKPKCNKTLNVNERHKFWRGVYNFYNQKNEKKPILLDSESKPDYKFAIPRPYRRYERMLNVINNPIKPTYLRPVIRLCYFN